MKVKGDWFSWQKAQKASCCLVELGWQKNKSGAAPIRFSKDLSGFCPASSAQCPQNEIKPPFILSLGLRWSSVQGDDLPV
ncbi:hypothetical protein [Ruegeria arenilitoris]|uniref:hypothetical protein n=1 Tax=Ruegeria arenilitoris TaxID=1173585 RepID=UPI00147AB1DA|nr:hypothetical protein [Ruegeria arenilitoris]